MRTKIEKEKIIEVCNRSESMARAASELGIHFNTLKRLAIEYGCYKPNQSLKGVSKPIDPKIPLYEILNGQHPHFQTFKLKNRMLKEGLVQNICSVCGISSWNGQILNMELDHIDGNRTNHKLENLRLLCPNCHAQTDTYRSKNRN